MVMPLPPLLVTVKFASVESVEPPANKMPSWAALLIELPAAVILMLPTVEPIRKPGPLPPVPSIESESSASTAEADARLRL